MEGTQEKGWFQPLRTGRQADRQTDSLGKVRAGSSAELGVGEEETGGGLKPGMRSQAGRMSRGHWGSQLSGDREGVGGRKMV